jgi:hypothetical protein
MRKDGTPPRYSGAAFTGLLFLVNIGRAMNFVVRIAGSQHQNISTFLIRFFNQLFFRIID